GVGLRLVRSAVLPDEPGQESHRAPSEPSAPAAGRQLARCRRPHAVVQPSPQSTARYVLVLDRLPRGVPGAIAAACGGGAPRALIEDAGRRTARPARQCRMPNAKWRMARARTSCPNTSSPPPSSLRIFLLIPL